MLSTTLHHRLWTLGLVLVLGVLLTAQIGLTQGSGEDYDVSILSPNSMSTGQDTEIIVRVRTPQGAPAHGVPVMFQLEPAWQRDATIVPRQTTTDHGIARAQLRTDLIGYVGMTVRVGSGTVIKHTGLAVSLREESEDSPD